jgi:hypothetical protein
MSQVVERQSRVSAAEHAALIQTWPFRSPQPRKKRLHTGRTAIELHGLQVQHQEAQSPRQAGKVEAGSSIGTCRRDREWEWDRGRRASLQIQEQGSQGEKVTCLGSAEEEEEEAHPPTQTAEGKGRGVRPKSNEIRLALVCNWRNRFCPSSFLPNAQSVERVKVHSNCPTAHSVMLKKKSQKKKEGFFFFPRTFSPD